jgi:transcriptional regulator with XRE-family HTH domain
MCDQIEHSAPEILPGNSRLAIRTDMLIHLVREARLRAGLSQAELAQRAGVPQSTVGRIESGARVPSTALLEALIDAAGFELRVGLGDEDPGTDSLFERTLRRSPDERLADATRAARFVLRGRRTLRRATRG